MAQGVVSWMLSGRACGPAAEGPAGHLPLHFSQRRSGPKEQPWLSWETAASGPEEVLSPGPSQGREPSLGPRSQAWLAFHGASSPGLRRGHVPASGGQSPRGRTTWRVGSSGRSCRLESVCPSGSPRSLRSAGTKAWGGRPVWAEDTFQSRSHLSPPSAWHAGQVL